MAHVSQSRLARGLHPPLHAGKIAERYFFRTFTLDEVVSLTQVSRETLYEWEDSYHLLASQQAEQPERCYTYPQIQHILKLKQLICEYQLPPEHVAITWGVLNNQSWVPRVFPVQAPQVANAAPVLLLAIQKAHILCDSFYEKKLLGNTEVDHTIQKLLELFQTTFRAEIVECALYWESQAPEYIGRSQAPAPVLQQVRHVAATAYQKKRAARQAFKDETCVTALPLRLGDRVFGTLAIARSHQPLNAQEHIVLTIFAAQIVTLALAHAKAPHASISDPHWKSMMDALPEGIIIRDRHHRIIHYNHVALQFAKNRDTILFAIEKGQEIEPEWEMTFPNGDPIPLDELPSIRALETGEHLPGMQCVMRLEMPNADPQLIPLLITAAPLFNEEGEIDGAVAIFQDITTVKEQEKSHAEYYEDACHNLRGPVTAIKLAVQMLQKHVRKAAEKEHPFVTKLAAKTVESTEASLRSIATLESQIDELMQPDLHFIGAPRLMSLFRFVNEYLHTLRHIHGVQRIKWDFDAADTRLEGYWFPKKIESIVRNLMDNALKYSELDTTVFVKLCADEYGGRRMAHLKVQDHGYGISGEDIKRIFEKGYRSTQQRPNGETIQGNGIGLYHCMKYAREHRGFLKVTSTRGQGSTFDLWLPLAE